MGSIIKWYKHRSKIRKGSGARVFEPKTKYSEVQKIFQTVIHAIKKKKCTVQA